MDDRYLMGSCHHLAVAMHRLTGWDLALIVGPMSGEDSIFHVFCIDPDGRAWDARGSQSVEDLNDEQEAMDGRRTWAIRLDDEAAIWSLAHGSEGKLYPIHETHILDAIEAVEEALDGAGPIISDGWKPKHPDLVEEAREGRRGAPALDRGASMESATSMAP